MWPLLIAELTISAVFIGLLVRALRRYDRHLTHLEAQLDSDRDTILADLRAQVDAAIAEMQTRSVHFVDSQPSKNGHAEEPVPEPAPPPIEH
jgi:hypothetical protein